MNEMWQKAVVEPLARLQEQVVGYLPNLFLAIFVVLVGLLVAWLGKQIVWRVLRGVQFDRLCERIGFAAVVERVGIYRSSSLFAGRLVQGFFWLLTFVLALNALAPQLSAELMTRFLLYLPQIFVAVLIVLGGALVGKFLGRTVLIAAVNAGLSGARPLAGAVQLFVWILSWVVALEQLGIGRTTLVVSFGILFGGLVAALAVAFGLAAKDWARGVLDSAIRRQTEEKETDDIRHV
ncbi:MAG: hypothetical protein HY653_04490 [Acidobacteria bacterium]|nr:hypothetical protein [Acidobacteriota bacterium]